MPTGYTAPIEEGNTNARDFVTHCARAFGAFVHQREEDLDSPPRPVEIKEDSYYKKALDEAFVRLGRLKSLSSEEIKQRYARYFDEITQSNLDSIQRHKEQVAKYQAVKDKVEAWEPNEEAKNLKAFAIDQLQISWPYDPFLITPVETPEEWYDKEVDLAVNDIQYYEDKLQKEHAHLQERREYAIRMLDSIAEVPE